LGLKLLQGADFGLESQQVSELISHYHLPAIKPHQGPIILNVANAAMDISDGLLIDAHAMAKVSQIVIELDLELMPTSKSARQALGQGVSLIDLAKGGDDYQILCAADPKHAHSLIEAGFSVMGTCRALDDSQKPELIIRSGRQRLLIETLGYEHQWA